MNFPKPQRRFFLRNIANTRAFQSIMRKGQTIVQQFAMEGTTFNYVTDDDDEDSVSSDRRPASATLPPIIHGYKWIYCRDGQRIRVRLRKIFLDESLMIAQLFAYEMFAHEHGVEINSYHAEPSPSVRWVPAIKQAGIHRA